MAAIVLSLYLCIPIQ